MVGRIATGEIDESMPPPDDRKDAAAVELGRKGRKARAGSMSAETLSKSARMVKTDGFDRVSVWVISHKKRQPFSL